MESTEEKKKYPSIVFWLIFILFAIGILTSGYFAYHNYENNYRKEIEHQLSSIAELKVNQLVQWRKERLSDAVLFFRNRSFSSHVKHYFNNRKDIDTKKRIQIWIKQLASTYSYNRICLHDITGFEHFSLPENTIEPSHMFVQGSTEAIKSGEIVFQDFYRDEHDQHVYLNIFVPIHEEYDNVNSRILGIVSIRIDPTVYLYPFIQNWPVPSKTSETLIVRRDGNDVLFLNELRFQKNTSLNLRFSPDRNNLPAMKAILGQEGIVEGIDYRGAPVIAFLHAIPESPWFLIAKTDKKEVYAPLRERLSLIIILVLTLLFGTGTGLSMIWRQQQNQFYKEQYNSAKILQENTRKLREAQEMAHLGFWSWDVKTGAVEWSEEVYKIFGLDPKEFTPQIDSILALSPWPEDHERDKDLINRAIESHAPGHYEQKFLRPDNSIGYYYSTFQGTYDENDKLTSIIGTVLDITERKQTEEKIINSETRLKEAQRIGHLGSWELDLTNDTLIWSDEIYRIFEMDPEKFDATYEAFLDTIHPDDRDAVNITYTNSLKTKKPYAIEHRLLFPDGRIKYVREQCETFYDANAQPLRSLGIIQDITERKQAEEKILKLNEELEERVQERTSQLEAANKELEAFSYSVSHDLRAPLRHVSGYVDLLMNRCRSNLSDKGVHYVDSIADSVHQMGVLIDNLLKFSRSGRVEMHKIDTDMNEMIEKIKASIDQDNPKRSIEWIIGKLPSVLCDPNMLHLVWMNLLSNAVKFTRTKETAQIEIGFYEKDKMLVFFVRDNGVGFDMQYAQKLFGVFQRLHPIEDFEGTGIGLANVNRIISRHGGHAWAEAKLDQGATFYFSLPK